MRPGFAELVEMVGAAKGQDRELDCRIRCFLGGIEFIRVSTAQDRIYPYQDREPDIHGDGGYVGEGKFLVRFPQGEVRRRGDHQHQQITSPPYYTSSVDTILCDVWPEDWLWTLRQTPFGHFEAYKARPSHSGSDRHEGPTAPLALLAAALSAIEVNESEIAAPGRHDEEAA